jgi:protein-disulfide isomerase
MHESKEKSKKHEEEIESKEEVAEDSPKSKKMNKQNMVAALIVLSGLFVGSLFVDAAQMVRGEGISLRKLKDKDVFTAQNKTWVAYSDPIVTMTVLSSDSCENCQVEPIIDAVKKTSIPTLNVKKVSSDSEEGKALVKKFGLKAIPSFIFDAKIKDLAFFEQAKSALTEKEGSFVLENSLAGIPYGKYLTVPEADPAVGILGNKDAQVKVVIFGDFQCPYSKQFADSFDKVFPEFKDKIQVSFRQFPLSSIHSQAEKAGLASLCANEQGKFWEMYHGLFANQKDLSTAGKEDALFTKLAKDNGLNQAQFASCLKDEKYKSAVLADEALAKEFALSGTPAAFVGSQFIGGVVDEAKIKEIIETELGIKKEDPKK